jgi:hypothetical protein
VEVMEVLHGVLIREQCPHDTYKADCNQKRNGKLLRGDEGEEIFCSVSVQNDSSLGKKS